MENKAERAKMFIPFESLKEYYDLILEKYEVYEEKRELSEDGAHILDCCIKRLSVGTYARVKYYRDSSYIDICGAITSIDSVCRCLTIDGNRIFFDDIIEAERYFPADRKGRGA
ncbi:MAG: hypothetical protein J6M17_01285 [Ruminococcus sp.]|nr:hypothetical protein [Ruminococcus sp.]